MTPKPIVAVRWMDAHGSATTAYAEHEIPHGGIEITTYGLLLRDDAVGVSVAAEACADGTYRGVTFVSRPMVLDIVPITKPRRPKPKEPTPWTPSAMLSSPKN